MMSCGIFALGFFLSAAPLLTWGILAAQDKIIIKTENGIPVVYNPKNPVPPPGGPKSLTLKVDLTIGENTTDENYMFSDLRSVQVDDQENIYVLDWKENKIKVYDKNGKHLRTFGKKGQGPGELDRPIRMEMTRDNHLVIDDMGNNKLVFFSPEGIRAKEIPTGIYWAMIRFKFDSHGNIYADTRAYEPPKVTSELKKFDPSFKPLATITSFEGKMQDRSNQTPFSPVYSLQMRRDDLLVWIIGDTDKYEFTVVNSEGKTVKKIIKEYDPVKITSVIRERIIREYFGEKGIPEAVNFTVPGHLPAVSYIAIDDENRMYAQTYAYEERNGEYWLYYDVFDAEGRYIAKFCHPRREMLFAVKKNKIYCMVRESQEGIPLVKRYSMVWK
jgi:hypothetical protein